ncbi:MAG: lytic transglycosylase domain-containing protein [Thermodesulfobacteriota bacterium]
MIRKWSNEQSLFLNQFVVKLGTFIFLFIFTLSSFGFWYIGSAGRLKFSARNYLNEFQSDDITVTKIKNLDFDSSEIEIFRLILRLTNSLNATEAYNLATVIYKECYEKGIDPSIVLGVIMVESRFHPEAVSNKGAMGLMQLMPNTGSYIAKQEGIELQTRNQLYDPEINVRIGIAYLSELEMKYNDISHALGAYNYGPYKFDSLIKASSKRILVPHYVSKVLKFKNRFDDELIILRES